MMSVPGVPVICADAIVVTTDPRHECVPEPEHTPQKSLSYRALVAPETTRRSDISVGRATDGNVLRGVPGMLHDHGLMTRKRLEPRSPTLRRG